MNFVFWAPALESASVPCTRNFKLKLRWLKSLHLLLVCVCHFMWVARKKSRFPHTHEINRHTIDKLLIRHVQLCGMSVTHALACCTALLFTFTYCSCSYITVLVFFVFVFRYFFVALVRVKMFSIRKFIWRKIFPTYFTNYSLCNFIPQNNFAASSFFPAYPWPICELACASGVSCFVLLKDNSNIAEITLCALLFASSNCMRLFVPHFDSQLCFCSHLPTALLISGAIFVFPHHLNVAKCITLVIDNII